VVKGHVTKSTSGAVGGDEESGGGWLENNNVEHGASEKMKPSLLFEKPEDAECNVATCH
jgi:hypothetical protein